MERDEARARMDEIQRVMQRTTIYTLLPGPAAIVGGVLVLVGCAASWQLFRSFGKDPVEALDFASLVAISPSWQLAFGCMWFLIGLASIALEAVLAARAAKWQGSVEVSRPARLAVFSLTPSVAVAVLLTIRILGVVELEPREVRLIVPIWMMLYGTGVYTAGLFSLRPPRVLGITFIALGAPALLWLSHYGVVWGALSFGLLHIVFGGVIVRRSPERPAVSEPFKPEQIDAVIHERVRLAVVSALAAVAEMSFNELKTTLDLTDGNLSAHLRTLEDAGYVAIAKSFQGRRPLTTLRLSAAGRKAFQRYLETLRLILDQGAHGNPKRGK